MGLGGQRHTLAALPQRRPSTLCREWWMGLGACPDGYKKMTSPQGFELQTIQHTVSHCAMYTVTFELQTIQHTVSHCAMYTVTFEPQTIQHTVSHCAMYTVTPHQEHNEVNVNEKISDLYGGHFLVSYAML